MDVLSIGGSSSTTLGSVLSGGLGSLDRWEGLKEWHKRHQDILQERIGAVRTTGQCQNEDSTKKVLSYAESVSPTNANIQSQNEILACSQQSEGVPCQLLSQKHNLSVITEGDEDSRLKDCDMSSASGKIADVSSARAKVTYTSALPFKFGKLGIGDIPEISKGWISAQTLRRPETEKVGSAEIQQQDQTKPRAHVAPKRPFLRKGQGLAKYNLRPEDVKSPYKKQDALNKNKFLKGPTKRPGTAASVRAQPAVARRTSCLQTHKSAGKGPPVPMQRLVLTVPPHKTAGNLPTHVESGTWSQLFSVPECKSNIEQEKGRYSLPEAHKISESKNTSSPEEDQDSLAAYLDLEQHVSNASFCSTSSKVDRLIAQSSKSTFHPSNPDTISLCKPPSPMRSVRGCVSGENGQPKGVVDAVNVWTAAELEDLIKSRARRSQLLVQVEKEPKQCHASSQVQNENSVGDPPQWGKLYSERNKNSGADQAKALSDVKAVRCGVGPIWEIISSNMERKPHLMKTMPGIDLDSSLIKNALVQPNDTVSTTDSSSESSSESDLDETLEPVTNNATAEGKGIQTKTASSEPQHSSVNGLHDSHVRGNHITVEGINAQIDAHLAHLRLEIETLQAANSKSQRSVSGLEKKVRDLESRLVLEARTCDRRIAEEREIAAKSIAEERAKFSKEKHALERTIRDLKKNTPDPITQQEMLRLKQEIAQWEEKWRADRAKSRGLESNLRIQITNLKRENEKLKEDNSKLRREKETAVNTAKAKTVSNTRAINSIAQQLGKPKSQVSAVQDMNKQKPLPQKGSSVESSASGARSAYNLQSKSKDKPFSLKSKPMATIGTFPKLSESGNEWSDDEEIDLGEESDDEDLTEDLDQEGSKSSDHGKSAKASALNEYPTTQQGVDGEGLSDTAIEEACTKYEAMFGSSTRDSVRQFEDMELGYHSEVQRPVSDTQKSNQSSEKFVETLQHPDGRIEQVKKNGTRVITYPDGTWERHSGSGSIMTVPSNGWPIHITYFNGDKLEKMEDGTVRYFYAKTQTWQTTFPDGHEEVQFPSGQVERRQQDGSVQVLFPVSGAKANGTAGSTEGESHPDGISVERNSSGDTIIYLSNGERELHTKDFMRKDFLDGTVKFIYKDGSQETRYPSGRIRVKDAQGNLIKDTAMLS